MGAGFLSCQWASLLAHSRGLKQQPGEVEVGVGWGGEDLRRRNGRSGDLSLKIRSFLSTPPPEHVGRETLSLQLHLLFYGTLVEVSEATGLWV